ncbi:MAG: hypothetical protein CO167_05610 [Candidatus Marinimicrobia bacterium CG_4_9_14_3_um_filter_48_9]|nr:MAG: hypothetical protein CO167_05610 [Candidatus Marinimicrobia bacterium CG_4_9_14_3_um_filter_48_9]
MEFFRLRIKLLSIVWLILAGFLFQCNSPTGLQPASGVEGTLNFQGNWPPAVQGAALVALSTFPADVSQAADFLVNYTTPVDSGSHSSEFFIQLKPGTYYLMTLGLTINPAVFAANLDSIKASGVLPVVLLETDLATISQPVTIQIETVKLLNRTVSF